MFTSSVEEITVQQLRLNCPYPIYNGDVTNLDIINGVNVNYTVTYANNITANGARFKCGDDAVTHNPTVSVSSEEYGATLFSAIPIGVFGYLSHSITEIFNHVDAFARLIYLIVFAPSQVSGLSFFIYIQTVLFALVAFGAFMVIRG